MEFTIKKILSIDSEVEELRNAMELDLISKKKELDDYLRLMEKKYNDETEKMKEQIIGAKIYQARIAAEEIKSSGKIEIEKLNNLYKMQKDSIVNEIFKYVIGSCREG